MQISLSCQVSVFDPMRLVGPKGPMTIKGLQYANFTLLSGVCI